MLATCAKHPDATAGWSCDSCEATLCPACAASKETPAGSFILCTRCGGKAQPILMARGELRAALQEGTADLSASPLGGLRALGQKLRGPKPGPADLELVPVLGDVQPLIQLGGGDDADAPVGLDRAGNPLGAAPAKPHTYEPIELDDEPTHPNQVGALLGQMSPTAPVPPHELELDLETGEVAPPADNPQAEPNATLARLSTKGDLAGCLRVLEQSGSLLRAQTLTPESWLLLGTKALEQRNAKAATFGLRRCIDAAPQGANAPRAWLLAARAYDELLGDRKTSDRLLEELMKRFPTSQEGQFATRRLAARPQNQTQKA